MRPHSKRLRQLALDLHQEHGLGPRTIGQRLGIPAATIARWIYPDYRARQNQAARAYKERRRGSCAHCGASTWVGSVLCQPCQTKKQRESRHWTKERVIDAIQRWNSQHGQPPSARDWILSHPEYPAMGCVYGRHGAFPNWADAIEAAGFPRPRPGWKKNDKHWDHDSGRRLRQLGVPDREIADRFGISTTTIRRHLGPRGHHSPHPVAANPFRTREQRIQDLQQAVEQTHA